MAVSPSRSVGTFLFDVATRTLTWTGEIFRIYGFEPSEVVPTLESVIANATAVDVDVDVVYIGLVHAPLTDRAGCVPDDHARAASAGRL